MFSTHTTLEDNFSQQSSIDTQHSIEDEEGNITMFSTPPHVYKPDYDQVMTSHEDLDRSPGQRLAHYESDSDSLSTDSQVSAPPQFRNDSADLDTARGLTQSYEIESTQEQGNLATADMGHRLRKATKRARSPDTTQAQSTRPHPIPLQ